MGVYWGFSFGIGLETRVQSGGGGGKARVWFLVALGFGF